MKRPTLQLAEVVGEVVQLGDPANDEAAHSDGADLVQWIDAIALAIAAGVRVGERGMARTPGTERADVALAPGHDPEVMDADELAAFLGVDRNTVYDYAGRGEIPHRRLGKRLLFSRRAIMSWLSTGSGRTEREGRR